MDDEKLSKLIANLEVVHLKLRNFKEKNELSGEALKGFNESYTLITECRDLLNEEEVKNEISKFSENE